MESVAVSYSATASAFFSLPSTPLAPSSSIGIVLKGRRPRKNSFSVSSLSKTLEKAQLSSSSSSKAVYSSARRAAITEVKGASIDLDSALSRVEGVLQLEDYNIILRYFGESRRWSEMSQLFEWMQRNEKLNFVSYSSFFKYIGINRNPAKALQVYESIPDELMKVNVSVCNSFLGCMVRNGRHESSLKFFNQMKDDGLTPDLITYSTLLAGCAKLKCGYSRAMELVQEIKSKDLHMDSVIYGNLLAICASNNLSEEAEMYFQKMKNEGYKPNLFHYSSLLNVYAMERNHMKAEKLVNDMKSSGLAPNKVILTTLLKVYARGGLFEKSKELFAELRALGYAGDEIPYCLLIDSLAKAGHIRDAKLLFADMKEKGVKSDGYSYSIMISALCRSGLLQEAKKLAQEFEASYEKYDLVMLNTLLRTYCNAGDMESVMKMLRKMDELTISPDWNTFHILIKYFCKEKLYHLAYKTTEDMHSKGHQLNEDLCSSVILQLGEAGFTSEAFSVYNMLRYSKRTICKSLHERMLQILVAAGFLKDAYVVMKDNMEVISMHSLEKFCISFIKSGNINMINDVLKAFHRSGNKIDPDIFHTAISRYIRMPDKKELLLQLLDWMSGQGYCVDSLSRNLLLKNSHLFGPKQLIAEILSKQKILSRKLVSQGIEKQSQIKK